MVDPKGARQSEVKFVVEGIGCITWLWFCTTLTLVFSITCTIVNNMCICMYVCMYISVRNVTSTALFMRFSVTCISSQWSNLDA